MRTVIRRLGLILMGTLLACLGLEIVLRFSDAVPEVSDPQFNFHRSDAYLGWSGKPNVRMHYHRPEFNTLIEHDADGWRLPQPAPPADPAQRILVLGDSFTWGWGVSQGEVFTDHLQAALAPRVAVVNRGIIGFGTAQELLVLQHELQAHRYDIVVVMFFLNDLNDNVDGKDGHRPYFDLIDDQLIPRNQPALLQRNPVEELLKLHSRAYLFFELEFGLVKRMWSGENNDERGYRERPAVDFHTLPGYAVTARLLAEMRRLTLQHGARFFLVYIPQRSEFERDEGFPYVRSIHAMVDAIAREAQIPLIDLTAPFRARTSAGESLVFRVDAHWTPAGHRLAADVLLASPVAQALRSAEASTVDDRSAARQ